MSTRSRAVAALLGLLALDAAAARIEVVGLSASRAFVSVDGAPPRGVPVGDSVAGYSLVSVDSNAATFVVDGRRQTIAMGSYLGGTADRGRPTAVFGADGTGHYMAAGSINGTATRFLVDTGATLVVLSARDAERLHVAYRQAPSAFSDTANGKVAYRVVKLDRIKVGDVELVNVDAGVLEGGYDGPPLLGMSFLSRTEISRDGQSMVLTRRF